MRYLTSGHCYTVVHDLTQCRDIEPVALKPHIEVPKRWALVPCTQRTIFTNTQIGFSFSSFGVYRLNLPPNNLSLTSHKVVQNKKYLLFI